MYIIKACLARFAPYAASCTQNTAESKGVKHTAQSLQPVMIYGGYSGGVHLFPFRTEKLSPPWPMVLQRNAGE